MKTPRWTDLHRFPHGPYVRSENSKAEDGYLRDKFLKIIERQQRDAAEAQAKTVPMRKVAR